MERLCGGVVSWRTIQRAVGRAIKQYPTPPKGGPNEVSHIEGNPPPQKVSDAKKFATMAISQLERIQRDDPERDTALSVVSKWIENKRR